MDVRPSYRIVINFEYKRKAHSFYPLVSGSLGSLGQILKILKIPNPELDLDMLFGSDRAWVSWSGLS
jgi:hypothetical protein